MRVADILHPRVINPREEAQTALFRKFMDLCADEQANTEMIAGAALNVLLTVVHRMHRTSGEAEARWDDLCGQAKQELKRRFVKK